MGYTATAEEEKDLTLPEDTIHTARLQEIKLRVISWKDKNTGEDKSAEILEWWWEITAGEYVGRKVKGECDTRFSTHPSNKLRNWASVLLDTEIGAGYPLDTDDLIGLTADIAIGHRPDKKDPAKIWEFVAEVLPASSGDGTPPF